NPTILIVPLLQPFQTVTGSLALALLKFLPCPASPIFWLEQIFLEPFFRNDYREHQTHPFSPINGEENDFSIIDLVKIIELCEDGRDSLNNGRVIKRKRENRGAKMKRL
ncbi:hypothetical protein HID58_088250, partial [Brassica napus]